MRLLLFIALTFFVLKPVISQTTVVDHRRGNDTTKPTTVVDHRIGRDMSASLIQPEFEEMPVYRIQLRITSGRGNGAGTDDKVYVQLRDSAARFYLAKGIDNFKEGSVVMYDVIDADIRKVKHIRMIRFGVEGNDGVCLKKVELFLNNSNSPVFINGGTISTERGVCIDNNSDELRQYTISRNELRASRNWNYGGSRSNMWRPPLKISKPWIESLIEAAIGNQITQGGSDLKWGTVGSRLENRTLFGPPVETKYLNKHTLSVDLDLELDLTGPNPETDVDFEIDFRCEEGAIVIESQNINISSDNIGALQNFYRDRIRNAVEIAVGTATAPPMGAITGQMVKLLLNFKPYLKPSTPGVSCSCTKTIVTEAGDILLQ